MDSRPLAQSIPSTRPERVDPLDEAAFAGFYERTERHLHGYVARVTGRAADAEDIVQEAYLRVLRVALPDDEQRRKYLYRVATHLIVDRWRRQGREATADARSETALAGRDARSSAGALTDTDVARLFGTLARRDRALLWLAYVEGESHGEIAEALGVGRRSVKVLLFRAKRRLRDVLTAGGFVSGQNRLDR